MSDLAESDRLKIAYVLLGVGLVLTLLGFALLFYNQPIVPDQPSPTTQVAEISRETKARALRQMLFWLVVLVVIFIFSTTAFLRWSRHFRRSILRKPQPPTPSEDVWAMHKLPEGAVEEWSDSNPDDSEPRGGIPPS